MLRSDLQPHLLDEQECKEYATRQLLSFITLPDTKEGEPPDVRPAPGAPSFSLEGLPDDAFSGGPELFNWKSRDIYDVDGLLLFRDLTLDIGAGRKLRSRTAASNLLQTQVWGKYFPGPFAQSDKTLIENALKELRRYPDLKQFIVDDDDDVRLVAYSYPNTGILCYSRSDPDERFVSKLGEPLIIPIKPDTPPENPESLFAVWSPYDLVGRHTIIHLRQVWEQNLAFLPPLPKHRIELPDKIREARKSVLGEHIVIPEVPFVPQRRPKTCAVAAALMLLKHHGIDIDNLKPRVTEQEIADNMRCEPDGARPEDQVTEVNRLLGRAGAKLQAVPDASPTFEEARDELAEERPLKIGGGHARVAVGFREQRGGQDWLWIHDPFPENIGQICCVPWTKDTGQDFMYVKPL